LVSKSVSRLRGTDRHLTVPCERVSAPSARSLSHGLRRQSHSPRGTESLIRKTTGSDLNDRHHRGPSPQGPRSIGRCSKRRCARVRRLGDRVDLGPEAVCQGGGRWRSRYVRRRARHRPRGVRRAVVDVFVHRGEADIGEAGGGEYALRGGAIGDGKRFEVAFGWGTWGRPCLRRGEPLVAVGVLPHEHYQARCRAHGSPMLVNVARGSVKNIVPKRLIHGSKRAAGSGAIVRPRDRR
jgi:hypothetical protein